MTTTPASPAAPQPTTVDAAPLILKSMGLTLEDLAAPGQRPDVPTFADYVPVVSAAVTDGTRKAYGSYWRHDCHAEAEFLLPSLALQSRSPTTPATSPARHILDQPAPGKGEQRPVSLV
jgi:hypothetical protein